MAMGMAAELIEFDSPYDMEQLPTDQKVGSSNLPGRAIFFKDFSLDTLFGGIIK